MQIVTLGIWNDKNLIKYPTPLPLSKPYFKSWNAPIVVVEKEGTCLCQSDTGDGMSLVFIPSTGKIKREPRESWKLSKSRAQTYASR